MPEATQSHQRSRPQVRFGNKKVHLWGQVATQARQVHLWGQEGAFYGQEAPKAHQVLVQGQEGASRAREGLYETVSRKKAYCS